METLSFFPGFLFSFSFCSGFSDVTVFAVIVDAAGFGLFAILLSCLPIEANAKKSANHGWRVQNQIDLSSLSSTVMEKSHIIQVFILEIYNKTKEYNRCYT